MLKKMSLNSLLSLMPVLVLITASVEVNEALGNSGEVDYSSIDRCLIAGREGNVETLSSLAQNIANFKSLNELEIIRRAEECLTIAERRPVIYSNIAESFQFDLRQVPTMQDEAHPLLLDVIEEARMNCLNFNEGKLTVPEKATTYIDITNDGLPEIFFDSGELKCSTIQNLFVGSAGRKISVIVNGTITSFMATVWTVEYPFGPTPVVLAWMHGSYCDRAGYRPCVKSLVWSEGEFLGD